MSNIFWSSQKYSMDKYHYSALMIRFESTCAWNLTKYGDSWHLKDWTASERPFCAYLRIDLFSLSFVCFLLHSCVFIKNFNLMVCFFFLFSAIIKMCLNCLLIPHLHLFVRLFAVTKHYWIKKLQNSKMNRVLLSMRSNEWKRWLI